MTARSLSRNLNIRNLVYALHHTSLYKNKKASNFFEALLPLLTKDAAILNLQKFQVFEKQLPFLKKA